MIHDAGHPCDHDPLSDRTAQDGASNVRRHDPLDGGLPFSWQRGHRLYLLDRDLEGWILAELEFRPLICRYIERRRSVYTSDREAFGALLSRTLAFGDAALLDASRSLDRWLLRRFGRTAVEFRSGSPRYH